ncbi:hypothetical protein BFG57_09835 [Bacillus solimangrovi]|uniref:Uncharacterized protein n=1 Tax=Bacillus solimangrovi TaxID=1305675 RepID=A0A1E5LJC1_9BACI|nr:hypothetical protein BFG57_09835 [Bacillus solimangrovi]
MMHNEESRKGCKKSLSVFFLFLEVVLKVLGKLYSNLFLACLSIPHVSGCLCYLWHLLYLNTHFKIEIDNNDDQLIEDFVKS